jgi:hypothetical protein
MNGSDPMQQEAKDAMVKIDLYLVGRKAEQS